MKKTGVPPIAWVLVGLLVIAAGLMSIGEQDQTARPETESYSPSGISAFTELLRRNGVKFTIDNSSQPKLGLNDVQVAFKLCRETTFGPLEPSKKEEAFDKNLWDHVKAGGSAILLPLKSNYLEASRTTKSTPFSTVTNDVTGETLKITDSGISASDGFGDPGDDDTDVVSMALWKDKENPFLNAYRMGKGTLLIPRDGIGITNRFIDKYDNAKAFNQIVGMLATSGKRVVFTEASFGNIKDLGLLETVGKWANAGWQQLIFLGIVVAFTWGKRFGLPEEEKSRQRGSRELLDAVADTFKRAKSTQAALGTAYAAADSDLRLILKLPRDAPRTDRDRLLPVSLQNALARLQVSSEYPEVTQDHALSLILEAQKELEAFIGPNRAKLWSLAKLRK